MASFSTVVSAACALLLSCGSAQAATIVYSCKVVQNLSGASYPETITLDEDTQVVNHLKRTWSEGGRPLIINDQVQFLEVTRGKLTWGSREIVGGAVRNLFSVDLITGGYTWRDTDGSEIAHGICKSPALTS